MNRERSGCLGRMSASFIAGQRLAMYLREEWRHIRTFLHQ